MRALRQIIRRRLRDFVARGEIREAGREPVQTLSTEAGALGLAGAREQNGQLRFGLDPTADLVLADRVQIQQVLVNLFRIALVAMAQSPRRELVERPTPRAADDMIEIEVADTGSGLVDDVIPNLFQTFFSTNRGRPVALWASDCPSAAPDHRSAWRPAPVGRQQRFGRRDFPFHPALQPTRPDSYEPGDMSTSSTTTRRCGTR